MDAIFQFRTVQSLTPMIFVCLSFLYLSSALWSFSTDFHCSFSVNHQRNSFEGLTVNQEGNRRSTCSTSKSKLWKAWKSSFCFMSYKSVILGILFAYLNIPGFVTLFVSHCSDNIFILYKNFNLFKSSITDLLSMITESLPSIHNYKRVSLVSKSTTLWIHVLNEKIL